jgi:DNA transformation protein and related proteins
LNAERLEKHWAKTRQWLAEIGIYTIEDLGKAGAITTYKILKERYPKKVSLNLFWGLEAAIRNVDWRELAETDKTELKQRLS